jgi:hypothetical protein
VVQACAINTRLNPLVQGIRCYLLVPRAEAWG